MKKIWIMGGILVLVVAIIVGFLVFSYGGLKNQNSGDVVTQASSTLAGYFKERMTTLGIADIGQPIEGFDADLLMKAYPGLENEDFRGVDAFGGHYEVENGEEVFVSDSDSMMSSADGAIVGYKKLLDNVESRTGVEIKTKKDIDALILRVNTADHIRTKIDKGASVFGIKIIPKAVVEDSRCPVDVQCIWAGTVKISAMVNTGSTTMDHTFKQGHSLLIDEKTVTLESVLPKPRSEAVIRPTQYRFIFSVEKNVGER